MSTRKGTADIFTGGESQKQTSAAVAKTKQKRASNASDSPPALVNSTTKKPVKKANLSQKPPKLEQKTVKTKVVKRNEKESEDSDERRDLVKKSAKQKLKEKLVTKTAGGKKPAKEVAKKGKNVSPGNSEKMEKMLKPKKIAKKPEDRDEKKNKVQKEKKLVKEAKKKPVAKSAKKCVEEPAAVECTKSRVEKKEKSKKIKAVAKNRVKLNSSKKIDDNPPIECMDVVKDEKPDDVALLQVFQLKNGPVCDFDGSVCNTITIRQDNTCIKIKEISVSQMPYPVKTEHHEKIDATSAANVVKKEGKQNSECQDAAGKQKSEKAKNDKQKAEKQPKVEKQKNVKQKVDKQKTEKPVTKPTCKAEKKKKPAAPVVDKIKSKGKTKVVPKSKAKGRPVSKRPRVASLNAIAKVHCLYENESKGALIDAMAASAAIATIAAPNNTKKKKISKNVDVPVRKGKRTSKRTTPGLKSVGRHWDMHDTSSTNSSSSGIPMSFNFNDF